MPSSLMYKLIKGDKIEMVKEQFSAKEEWVKLYGMLTHIEGFDSNSFIKDTKYEIGQLKFFYNNVTRQQTGNPSTSFYKPKIKPESHQLAYFNLTQGFPKELRGGHWCYIVKQVKSKFIVIPCTSVKDDSTPADPEYQMDIEIDGFPNGKKARLQLSDIRAVDAQRLYSTRGLYDIVTEKGIILNSVFDALYE